MARTATEAFETRLCDATETYLQTVTSTTDGFTDAMADYHRDPETIERTRGRLRTLETACDESLDAVRRLIGESMPPNVTEAYLRTEDLLALFQYVDRIPNRIERFTAELYAIDPPIDADIRACIRDVSGRIAVATATLSRIVEAYVSGMCSCGEGIHVEPHVRRIARCESDCDAIRDRLIEHVCRDGVDAEALVVRELIVVLDSAMDAVEDAGDHLLYMNSADF